MVFGISQRRQRKKSAEYESGIHLPKDAAPVPYIYTQPGRSDDGVIIRTAYQRIGIAVWEAHGAGRTQQSGFFTLSSRGNECL